jgi:hypothetical protein
LNDYLVFSTYFWLYLNILVFQYLILIAEILFMRLNNGDRQGNCILLLSCLLVTRRLALVLFFGFLFKLWLSKLFFVFCPKNNIIKKIYFYNLLSAMMNNSRKLLRWQVTPGIKCWLSKKMIRGSIEGC